jgi:hypothetical protein
MGYLDNWKNIRKNWNTIQKNPYAYQKLYYYFYVGVLILVAIVMAVNAFSIFKSYSAGSNTMSIVSRGFLLLVMALFASKLFKMKNQAKKILLHYDSSPTTVEDIPQHSNVDVVKEVDSILEKYGDKNAKR